MSPATAAPAVLAAGIPSPAQGVWHLGPIPLRAYAFAILTGIVIATWIAVRRYRARGGPEGTILDSIFWAVPLGIVGARIYHVLSSPDAYFGPNGNPWNAFAIWNGGLGIWGAIPAGALGIWIYLRRRGLRLATVADAMAPGVLVAQAIGRLGNYFNQELFGEPSSLPWGLEVEPDHYNFPADVPADTLFHPTFLYESIWNLLGVAILLLIDRRFKLRKGMMLWSYIVWYTLGRIPIESIRLDKAQEWTVLGIEARTNTWTSVLMFLIAVTLLVYSIVTRPKTPTQQAEADKIYRDDYVGEEDTADSPVDSTTTSNNEVATSDNGDTSNPTT